MRGLIWRWRWWWHESGCPECQERGAVWLGTYHVWPRVRTVDLVGGLIVRVR